MDFSILYAIRNLRTDMLDKFILAVTNITGSYGQIWLVIAAALLFFKKTRKCGVTMILSYAIVYIVGQYGLKDLIARPRPCHLDETVELLIKRPSSFSCPSTHSAWAFAAAASVFAFSKPWGAVVTVAAVVIAFSRLYLFVHFPTDVLFGAVLGILAAAVSVWLVNAAVRKIKAAKKTE